MRELLTPPGHRGPLIAAGAVVLTVGVALEQVRMRPGAGVQFVVLALLAALLLWLALQGESDAGDPPAWASVLLVAGLLALLAALLRFADLVADPFAGDFPSGTVVWIALVQAAFAGFACRRRGSAVALLIAAVAGAVAVLSLYDFVLDPSSPTPYRWLLLLLALTFAVASLTQRGAHGRHGEQLVNAAGLSLLSIAFTSSPFVFSFAGAAQSPLPDLWETVLLGGGLGLVAYAAADRAAGAAYLGVLCLVAFIAYATATGEETLAWWPVLLLVLGGATVVIGLRPRTPLPPAPEASTRPDDQPLAARSEQRDT